VRDISDIAPEKEACAFRSRTPRHTFVSQPENNSASPSIPCSCTSSSTYASLVALKRGVADSQQAVFFEGDAMQYRERSIKAIARSRGRKTTTSATLREMEVCQNLLQRY